jgi:hypothetical protein
MGLFSFVGGLLGAGSQKKAAKKAARIRLPRSTERSISPITSLRKRELTLRLIAILARKLCPDWAT